MQTVVTRTRWMNPFYAEHFELRTALTPPECAARIGESVISRYSPRTWFFAREDWPVVGKVSGTAFWVQRLHTLVRPWSLQQASGHIQPTASGSVLRVRVGMKPVNAMISVSMLAVVALAALAAALAFPETLAPYPAIVWMAWPASLAVWFALDRIWWVDDASYLRTWLSETVGEHPSVDGESIASLRVEGAR